MSGTAYSQVRNGKKSGVTETPCVDRFEQRLLDHVEILYDVALELTQNPVEAEKITRHTLCKAWRERAKIDMGRGMKTALLSQLRHTFIKYAQAKQCHSLLKRYAATLTSTDEFKSTEYSSS